MATATTVLHSPNVLVAFYSETRREINIVLFVLIMLKERAVFWGILVGIIVYVVKHFCRRKCNCVLDMSQSFVCLKQIF